MEEIMVCIKRSDPEGSRVDSPTTCSPFDQGVSAGSSGVLTSQNAVALDFVFCIQLFDLAEQYTENL